MDKAKYIVIDLETYRCTDPDVVRTLTTDALLREPAKNEKVAVKKNWDTPQGRQARVDEALEKTSVDPLLAEVVCIGYKTDTTSTTTLKPGVRQIDGERRLDPLQMLADAALLFDSYAGPQTTWVGHNMQGFDLGILLNQWRRYSIHPPTHFPPYRNGKWRGRLWDTMKATPCKNALGFIKLDAVCQALGMGPGKAYEWEGMPMEGSRVGELVERALAGEDNLWLVLQEYCACDIDQTEDVFLRQTCRGAYPAEWRDAVAEQVRAIEESEGTEAQKAVGLVSVLGAAGLIPR